MNTRRSSLAVGAGYGAITGAVIQGLDYAVVLADLWHDGLDPMEFGDFGYLGAKVITGIVIGAICGLVGACFRAFSRYDWDGERKLTIYIAGGVLFIGVAACVACVAMAAFGLSVAGVPDPFGDVTVGAVFCGLGSYAAGILVAAVAAVDADDTDTDDADDADDGDVDD
ncbi:hypothetical protein [Actinomadura sp. NPDC049753]|uniref:hypothetical protein n=1 Tax=Actinomadura sp. NPDC049753 TaxID=3154739 RepID=UPI003414CD83